MTNNFLTVTKLYKILSDISKRSCDTLNPNEDLFALGVLDSFGIVEFVVTLEKNLNLKIPQEDLIPQNFLSINAIYNMLERLRMDSNS